VCAESFLCAGPGGAAEGAVLSANAVAAFWLCTSAQPHKAQQQAPHKSARSSSSNITYSLTCRHALDHALSQLIAQLKRRHPPSEAFTRAGRALDLLDDCCDADPKALVDESLLR